MRRVCRIYIAEGYAPLYSDRMRHEGSIGAAITLGERAAKREYGPRGECLHVQGGDYHRVTGPNAKLGAKPESRRLGRGYTDWHVVIGVRMGCDVYECQEIVIPIRISRARGEREYYER